MLLVTLTFDNDNDDEVTRYISNEPLALTNHFWDAYVESMPAIQYALSKPFGGRVLVSVGEINLIPAVFDNEGTETGDTWPPPMTMTILVEYADDDDGSSDKALLFEGSAHRKRIDRGSIGYDLYPEDPSYKVRSLAIDQSLSSLFTDFAAMWTAVTYTLVSTYATGATTVNVDIVTPDTEMLFVDILADICEFFGYFFYIDHLHQNVHLVAMATSNGTSQAITEYEFFPSRYSDPPPIKYIHLGEEKIVGDYVYGEDLTFSNICATTPYIRIGENGPNDETWMVHYGNTDDPADQDAIFIPFSSDKIYRYTLEYRKVTGTHSVGGGFHCMDDLTTSLNIDGNDTHASQCFVFTHAGVSDNGWHTVVGYIADVATPGTLNTGSDGTTVDNAIYARTGTSYIRPIIMANYDDQSGKTDIRYCAIHEVEHSGPARTDSDGSVVATLFEFKASYWNDAEWQAYEGSLTSVESPMQDALDNIMAIADKPIVELRMPLTKDTIYSMGQELTFDDDSQHQTVDMTMKIRSMNFNFDEDEVVLVGEGALIA